MKKLIIFLICVGSFVYGANQYAPQLAEEGLYHSLQNSMQLRRSDVQVKAQPGIKIVTGAMDTVQIHGQDAQVGSLKLASFDCNLQGVHFSPQASLIDGKLSIMRAESGDMTASIRSEDLRRFLIDKVDNLSNVKVVFDDDMVYVTGTMSLGGIIEAKANIRGHFGMQEKKLMFIPTNVSVEGMGMAYKIKSPSVEIYDFSNFPLGILPDTVTMQRDMVTIHGRVRNY
ncbi:MAG: DUF2993 domain-containing protein [Megasphaera sp.]|jgi:hypothetical protein|uniref:LmeA family phospholipid-binding protein n=1 Tax=Megasphaera sueciensis TaxID=349094 RepID=UPI003CFECF94|nr:DUF2993 domain-containing protein [Megasphaera sp.]